MDQQVNALGVCLRLLGIARRCGLDVGDVTFGSGDQLLDIGHGGLARYGDFGVALFIDRRHRRPFMGHADDFADVWTQPVAELGRGD
jgi:hypothetical protein